MVKLDHRVKGESVEIKYKTYTLREFQPGDETGILKLWQTAFKAEMDPALLKWKHLDNPYGRTMVLCIAEDREIVTFYGGIAFQMNCQGRTIHAVHLMDIMSHPGHRENRVFAQTARAFMKICCVPDKLQFMYGFPGAFHYDVGERLLNYRKISSVKYWTARAEDLLAEGLPAEGLLSEGLLSKDPKAETDCKHHLKQNSLHGQKGCKAGHGRKEVPIPSIAMIPVAAIGEMDELAPAFDQLWQACLKDYPLSVARDARFVKWRYFQHPHNQYNVFVFQKKSDGSGFGRTLIRTLKSFFSSKSDTFPFTARRMSEVKHRSAVKHMSESKHRIAARHRSAVDHSFTASQPSAASQQSAARHRFMDKGRYRICAYLVFCVNNDKLVLVDILMPDSLTLFKEIMGCAARYMINEKFQEIETWLPENHFIARHAEKAGFKESQEPLGIIPTVSLFDHSPSLAWVTENFYYNMGDGDLF
ncbi:MAG: GNAT family N-acetyltransferase [Thermodesulfobacteriota bacterium]|nr:GNAT family N-acetyltransferase [Thermodesulfobacteriota bacterium]